MMYGWGYDTGYGLVRFFCMILMMALFVAAIIWVARSIAHGSAPKEGGDTALDILKQRYAKGEIDQKEFAEKKKDLSQQ